MRARLSDVATRAGVSKGTVSHVLNHPDRVAPATREKVEKAISELGFVPHGNARSLAVGSAPFVGAVLADLSNTFFTDILSGIEEVTDEQDAYVLAADSRQSLARELRYLGLFEGAQAIGTLLTLNSDEHYREFCARPSGGRPLVVLNYRADPALHCSVHADNLHGGALLARHLLDLGRRRIALVVGLADLPPVAERVRGFARELAREGVEVVLEAQVPTVGRTSGWEVGPRIAEAARLGEVDAVFAVSDLLAAGLVQSLTQGGVRVPDDVAVVGYDDNQAAWDSPLPLTTVRQGGAAMGAAGARLLFDEVAEVRHAHRAIGVEPLLVVRASTVRPSSAV